MTLPPEFIRRGGGIARHLPTPLLRPRRSRSWLWLAFIATTSACGGIVARTGGGAPDGSTAPAEDAALAADAGEAGADLDAPTPCEAPAVALPVPGPGQCLMPSGRLCAGSCVCDDGCNTCWCRDGGGVSQTDIACTTPPTVPTDCTPSTVTTSCRAVLPFPGECPASAYYCSASVLAACGTNACPAPGCSLLVRDGVGGAYWCCP
jgi:hypothetical protein